MRNPVAPAPTSRKVKLSSTASRLPKAVLWATVLACLLFLAAVESRADNYSVTFFTGPGLPYVSFIDTTTGLAVPGAQCNLVPSGFTMCSAFLTGIAVPFDTTIPFNSFGLVNVAQAADPGLIADQLFVQVLSPNTDAVLHFDIFPSAPTYHCADYGGCGFTEGALQTLGSISEGNDPITVSFQSSAPAAVPEPASALLVLTGFGMPALSRLRRWVAGRPF